MASVTVEDSGKGAQKLILLDFAVRRAAVIIGERIKFRAVQLQTQVAPETIATGQTRRSIAVRPPQFANDPQGRYVLIKVGPRTQYAKWGIEKGRSANKPYPPFRRIYEWVREKPGGSSLSERELYAVTVATRRKIAQEGFKAQHIMSTALALEKPNIGNMLRTSIIAILRGK